MLRQATGGDIDFITGDYLAGRETPPTFPIITLAYHENRNELS